MRRIPAGLWLIPAMFIFIGCSNEMKYQSESDHFIFRYCRKDQRCLPDLKKALESNFARITNDLHYPGLTDKIIVSIYPDLKTYHRMGLGVPGQPVWFVGSIEINRILMVSPINPGPAHDYKSMLKTVVHEFTHIITLRINSYMPVWLKEGVAVYEAGQKVRGHEKFISIAVKKSKVPSLEQLNTNFYGIYGGYQFAYTIVEFVADKYGFEKLNKLIRAPEKIKTILGISNAQFEGRWMEYLKARYK